MTDIQRINKIKKTAKEIMEKPFNTFLTHYTGVVEALVLLGNTRNEAIAIVDECIADMYKATRKEK